MIRIIEKYLAEDIAAVKKQYSYIPDQDFDMIIRVDPTFDENRDSVGKYGKWLLGLYKKSDQRDRPYKELFQKYNVREHLTDWLRTYNNYCNDRTKIIEKDIMRFRNHMDLKNAIDNVQEAELSKKQQSRQAEKDKPYYLLFEGDIYNVYYAPTQAGEVLLAKFGGSRKANWCTAAESESGKRWYDNYTNQKAPGGEKSKLYVLINKDNYNDKYQFHFESSQFNNWNQGKRNQLLPIIKKDPKLWQFFADEGYKDRIGEKPPEKAPKGAKKVQEVKPIKKENIIGVTILTVDEIEELVATKDRKAKGGGANWWWTATAEAGTNNQVKAINDSGQIADKVMCVAPLGVRPALKLQNIESDNLSVGDLIGFNGSNYKIISNEYAIAEKIIMTAPFNKERNTADANNFELSSLKATVDRWFESSYSRIE